MRYLKKIKIDRNISHRLIHVPMIFLAFKTFDLIFASIVFLKAFLAKSMTTYKDQGFTTVHIVQMIAPRTENMKILGFACSHILIRAILQDFRDFLRYFLMLF
jgi:hypothetical protein